MDLLKDNQALAATGHSVAPMESLGEEITPSDEHRTELFLVLCLISLLDLDVGLPLVLVPLHLHH